MVPIHGHGQVKGAAPGGCRVGSRADRDGASVRSKKGRELGVCQGLRLEDRGREGERV